MSELIITQEKLLRMQELCDANLLNHVFDVVRVIHTQESNYWNVTTFLHNENAISLIDKVQVVSLFIYVGGRVDLDSNFRTFIEWHRLWNYMLEHRYISDNDYDFLNNHWMENDRVERKE